MGRPAPILPGCPLPAAAAEMAAGPAERLLPARCIDCRRLAGVAPHAPLLLVIEAGQYYAAGAGAICLAGLPYPASGEPLDALHYCRHYAPVESSLRRHSYGASATLRRHSYGASATGAETAPGPGEEPRRE